MERVEIKESEVIRDFSTWISSDDGVDFLADLLLQAEEMGGRISRYDIGMLLKNYGVVSTKEAIAFFVELVQRNGYQILVVPAARG